MISFIISLVSHLQSSFSSNSDKSLNVPKHNLLSWLLNINYASNVFKNVDN